jgi:hypothetical protein
MPQGDLTCLFRGDKSLAGVFPDRLQHPEPVARAVRLDERLVDERLQLVEDRLASVCADGLQIGEGATPCEHGHASEQALLRLLEERMAPSDRGAQRLVSFGAVAGAGSEHREGVVGTIRPEWVTCSRSG